MSKVWKFSDDFLCLEEIKFDSIISWLGKKVSPLLWEDYFANLLLYPETVPLTSEEVDFQLAVLRESLKMNPAKFYNPAARKMIIPERFLTRFTDLDKVIEVFLDAFYPVGLTVLVLEIGRLGLKIYGTVIVPQIISEGVIKVTISDQEYTVKIGSLVSLPAPQNKVNFKFVSASATIFNKDHLIAEVGGGPAGIIIDSRLRRNISG